MPDLASACSPEIESPENATQRDRVVPLACWTTTATRSPEAAAQVAAAPGPGMTEAGMSSASPRTPDSRTRRSVSAIVVVSTLGW